jgi:hypothetical protein
MTRMMLSVVLAALLMSAAAALCPAQEQPATVTLRTLPVDWYEVAGEGVKAVYRTFNNDPVPLYLPSSFERKLFRFIETPREYGGTSSLPFLLVHMRGPDVIFVDIYTKFMRTDARIADFDENDVENFKSQEQKGKIELRFY